MSNVKYILDQRTNTTHNITGIQDATLSTEGVSADAKAVGDALATKAEVDGYYEELTAGNAEQLVSSVGVEDSTPYNFRTTGGSADVGNRMNLRKVVGGTVAWNQLMPEYTQDLVSNGITTKRNHGHYTSTGIPNATWASVGSTYSGDLIADHVYILSVNMIKNTNSIAVQFATLGGNTVNPSFNLNSISGLGIFARVFKSSITSTSGINIGYNGLTVNADIGTIEFDLYICDITKMFDSTIANYLYSLGSVTNNAAVQWFRMLFPKSYYSYDKGSLQSVKVNSHKTIGFNALSSVTNGDAATQYTIALYGKADLLPNTTYCLSFVGASGHYLYPNEYLFTTSGRITLTGNRQYIVLTTLSNVGKDITYQYDSASGWKLLKNGTGNTVVPNFTDVCLNLHWDGERDGEYEPYEAHEYALDDVELRGIPKLDANNNLYYDGDEYTPDGVVNRRYGIVDLGTLTWTKSNTTAGNWWFSTAKSDAKKAPSNTEKANVICSNKYSVCTPNQLWAGNEGIGINAASAHIVAVDETYETVEAFKTAMSGVYLVYELETPTTESADPYQETQIVDDFGTEEFVDAAVTASTPTRDVEIPVGHDSYFQSNLRAKLEMAPDSPSDGNGDYVVRQTNGTNEYVKLVIPDELPDNPTTDGNYVLKCTVSNGTATLTWEAQS